MSLNQPNTARETEISRLLHVRTCVCRDDPETVVLEVGSASGTQHFSLSVGDLLRLGKQLVADATLLGPHKGE